MDGVVIVQLGDLLKQLGLGDFGGEMNQFAKNASLDLTSD